MKKKIILLLLILLSGCQTQIKYDYSEILQYKNSFVLREEPIELTIQSPKKEDYERLTEYSQPVKLKIFHNYEDIFNDIMDLEWLIKTFYGRYPLFEKQFNDAFEKIKDALPASGMDRASLATMIVKEFDFDQDLHFSIDHYSNYQSRPNYFDLDNEYQYQDGLAINTKTKEILKDDSYLVPFLVDDFNVVYKEMNNSSTIHPRPISRTEISSLNLNVPYFHMKSFGETNTSFDSFAREINKENISVLDLRNNIGGNPFYPGQWFKSISNGELFYSFDGYLRMNPNEMVWFNASSFNSFLGAKQNGEYFEFQSSKNTIKKDGLIIVLQNGETASAAELLIDYLHHLDNTIFIGTKTKGAAGSNILNVDIFLQNTGLQVVLGNQANLYQSDYYIDGEGFHPDLYVLDYDMQSVIESLIEKLSSK